MDPSRSRICYNLIRLYFIFQHYKKKIPFRLMKTTIRLVWNFNDIHYNIFVVQVISLLMEESAIMNVYAHNCTCTCTPVCNSVGKWTRFSPLRPEFDHCDLQCCMWKGFLRVLPPVSITPLRCVYISANKILKKVVELVYQSF